MADPLETLYFVPHTHWEGAVFKTREAYLDEGLPIILRALRLLEKHPNYRFTLDQACYVEPFLQRYPEKTADFQRFVDEGRLGIVGGTDVMLDVNMPGGESFIRQVLYGKRFFREKLGVDVTVGWGLDTFGHHAQMPQLLKLCGFTSYWFARGVPARNTPAEFDWEGLDGTRIDAYWLPHSYAVLYGSPDTLPEFTAFFKERHSWLTATATGSERVGLAGADVCLPEEHVPVLVEAFNAQADRPFHLELAVPTDFTSAVAKRPGTPPVIRGELNPIFQGIYSSRIELKQVTRELETLLTTAEGLGALLSGIGIDTDQAAVWRAWEPMLFNQAHDLMSGVMTDHVYDDTLASFAFSKRLATELVDNRAQAIIDKIDTRGDGVPLVVFNAVGWVRSDIVIAHIGFAETGIKGVALHGPGGETVPCQLLNIVRYSDGGILEADVAFQARDIPAMGYAVYHIAGETGDSALSAGCADNSSELENEFYKLTIDKTSGAITSIHVKDGNWEALAGPANVIAMEPDHGDLWELYRPLDATSDIAMKERHTPPAAGAAVLSTDGAAAAGTFTRGPVMSEFTISKPFSKTGRFKTTIRLWAGQRRVDIQTRILNNSERVRYRALFPTSIADPTYTHEIPYGAIERPDGIEFPAQNWIDCGTAARGIALLNRGLPGNNIADGTMMLSLLRSASIVAYGYGGGYEPGMGSDSGLELGKEITFDYALVPHNGDWREAAVYRDGLAFNHPLIARKAAPHAGALPAQWGYLTVSHPNVVVSSLKPSEHGDRIVVRVYEAAGTSVDDVTITFAGDVKEAVELNFVEDEIGAIAIVGKTVRFALRAFEVKTIGIVVDDYRAIT